LQLLVILPDAKTVDEVGMCGRDRFLTHLPFRNLGPELRHAGAVGVACLTKLSPAANKVLACHGQLVQFAIDLRQTRVFAIDSRGDSVTTERASDVADPGAQWARTPRARTGTQHRGARRPRVLAAAAMRPIQSIKTTVA
jgi:hypothetical protein